MEENHERSFASVYTKLLNRFIGNCKTIVQVSLFRANFKKFALYHLDPAYEKGFFRS